MIVGGYAVAFHGHPRFTGDIDIFVRPDAQTGAKLMAVLADFGFADVGLSAADFAEVGQVVQLGRPPNRIDLLTGISGVTFEEAFASRLRAKLGEHDVWFIGRDALLKNKRAIGRSKDDADADAIE